MGSDLFDACWERIDRVDLHRQALMDIWHDHIADHPFDFEVRHEGSGIHILRVHESRPMPVDFSLTFGEWLYNARALLDYIVWATAAHVTGQVPPPDEGTLQYPIYDSLAAWSRNEYRLKHLADHHRQMLRTMQPFESDLDANYLGVINRLARIDRHRRRTIATAYLADVQPVIRVPAGSTTSLEWGQRVLMDGEADVARITVTPWTRESWIDVNPRIGIDPEIEEWRESAFWRRLPFGERLTMMQLFLSGEVATYEYDCTGSTKRIEMLTASYRAECDRRKPFGHVRRAPRPAVAWSDPATGTPSTEARFNGDDFPSGASAPRTHP